MNIKSINDLLNVAKQHLKKPSIVLALHDSRIKIKQAPMTGKNPGALYVINHDTREYYGKILADGTFVSSVHVNGLTNLLQEFSNNPAEVAGRHGRLMGLCCFCYSQLSDERSTEVGYGPICAKHYGLPWGHAQTVKFIDKLNNIQPDLEDEYRSQVLEPMRVDTEAKLTALIRHKR